MGIAHPILVGGAFILPTTEQAFACVRVCQMLSNLYKDIRLFRFDDTTGQVYILAGDELQVIVLSNGIWDFVNEPEL